MKLEQVTYLVWWLRAIRWVLLQLDKGFAWVSSLQTGLWQLRWKLEDKYCQCRKCKERRKEQ